MFKDKRRILLYAGAPASLSLLFIALYFSGIEILQTIASPTSQREFGLIENAQNLLLLSTAAICWRAARLEKQDAWRRFWYCITFACLVLFMEEIDWGDHYWSALTGTQRPGGEHFNIHNQGNITRWLKKLVDGGSVVFFLLLPLARKKLPLKLQVLIPDMHSALPLLCGLLTSKLAHGLEDAGWDNNGSLFNNISEFRETFTYWVGLLYCWEVARRRKLAAQRLNSSGNG
ncbi:MAG: hypothetical protein GY899_15105 [Verrucomicrobiaceae bacterium]|nr:hypothetical protein [Verrucomicrobiaceae bacterium]